MSRAKVNLENEIFRFRSYLKENERSAGTIEKYTRDLRAFGEFLGEETVSKEKVREWKKKLSQKGYAITTVNSMLAAVNTFLEFAGCPEYRVRPLRQQKEIFSDEKKELTKKEYFQLLKTAESCGNRRLSLVMQTICSTGIRISELQYITVQSLRAGRTEVECKGKIRVIFLTKKLRKLLKEYCREQGIKSGAVFVTKNGKALDRSNIWREMKGLCEIAGVPPSKVFPHNLRHLFAKIFYTMEKDIVKLADLLGHSSIETTRIYIKDSGLEHGRKIERLHLLL